VSEAEARPFRASPARASGSTRWAAGMATLLALAVLAAGGAVAAGGYLAGRTEVLLTVRGISVLAGFLVGAVWFLVLGRSLRRRAHWAWAAATFTLLVAGAAAGGLAAMEYAGERNPYRLWGAAGGAGVCVVALAFLALPGARRDFRPSRARPS
jgi:peptidoglycan/LPS O-acetylase OafA/YrhL